MTNQAETRKTIRCAKCGGTVIQSYGEASCLQCGAGNYTARKPTAEELRHVGYAFHQDRKHGCTV